MPVTEVTTRRLRRYEAAENVARAFREIVAMPAAAPDGEKRKKWEIAADWLIYWLEFSDREFKSPPDVPPVPAKWKYNREQAMLGWPEKRKDTPDHA